MSLLLEMFTYPFILRAFAVGILVSLCAALLGVPLVLKRYSMIGDGLSHVSFGALAVGAILLLLVILSLIGLDRLGGKGKQLRILVPESLDYTGVFDNVLKKYCRGYHLNRIRTEDYGTLVRLDYRIVMKDDRQEKQFLDELRVLNGNLTISIVQTAVEEQ